MPRDPYWAVVNALGLAVLIVALLLWWAPWAATTPVPATATPTLQVIVLPTLTVSAPHPSIGELTPTNTLVPEPILLTPTSTPVPPTAAPTLIPPPTLGTVPPAETRAPVQRG